MATSNYARGAEWRLWDFHIHTPASYEWKGSKRFFEMNPSEKRTTVDQMINALNQSSPSVFVLMDYWTFDGWFALKERLSEAGAPSLNKTVFPGIELRLISPTKYRLNAHVVFSDDVSDQDLLNFKSQLEVALIKQPLSDECLIRLAREKLGDDLLEINGFKPNDVAAHDTIALLAGSKAAEITPDSYQEAIKKVPSNKAIGFMPWDTNDGLAKADWIKHYSYVIGLMHSSPIFETRRQELWAAFSGVKTEENKNWINSFQSALGNTPRLAVSGSDAHSFSDYGKYPSGKATWLKADPTFLGLRQAIKEPAKRSFIGEIPDKVGEVFDNKIFFIDSVEVVKEKGSPLSDNWLDSCKLFLNPDLVAIIGNKGSGKSALADVIALLGNSRQKDHFSFLSNKRFRARPKELAKHFVGKMTWLDSASSCSRNLLDDPDPSNVELVRYIPQAHFEKLCNDHVTGKSDTFENELRAVIFSHTNEAIRQKALDFNQLIERQESTYRDQLGEYRKDLKKINQEIENIEKQLQPEVRKSLEQLLAVKQKQIDEHYRVKPIDVPKPSEELTEEQRQASDELDRIAEILRTLDDTDQNLESIEVKLAAKEKSLQTIRDRLRLLEKQYKQFQDDIELDLETLGLTLSQVVTLAISDDALNQLAKTIPNDKNSNRELIAKNNFKKQELIGKQVTFKAKLNEPQQLYQNYLQAIGDWQERLSELIGSADAPETLEGIKERILQLDALPNILSEKQSSRLKLAEEIYGVLDAQRKARAELFKPVQDLIQNNSLIRDDYKLQFQATLGGSSDALASTLFGLIKQNAGGFRGEEESYGTVRKIVEQYDLNEKLDALKFINEMYNQIITAAKSGNKDAIGIGSLLRVNKAASEVYDLLFGFPFLEPRYSLLFQDTQIEQLSPGQRGALLLIFYLLVDKGRNPIILDQPEENLDNETVVSLLVPVLNEAKKRRQIIMVTHNPNLAVVCDAEQIIYSTFERKNSATITYESGAIENPIINAHVVNVLEGTKPAFDNRSIKYH